jgi:hypothetical protein
VRERGEASRSSFHALFFFSLSCAYPYLKPSEPLERSQGLLVVVTAGGDGLFRRDDERGERGFAGEVDCIGHSGDFFGLFWIGGYFCFHAAHLAAAAAAVDFLWRSKSQRKKDSDRERETCFPFLSFEQKDDFNGASKKNSPCPAVKTHALRASLALRFSSIGSSLFASLPPSWLTKPLRALSLVIERVL